jgi:hypothetical protein
VVKNGGVLERLARCATLMIDKTGTLTVGQPAVTAVVSAGTLPPEEILTLAASRSAHRGHRRPGSRRLRDRRSHRALYGLHAILRLHTMQEDETYLSLVDSADTPSS